MNKTQLEIIFCKPFEIFKWFRKKGYGVKEAKEISKNKIIDFNGDLKKTLEFFDYIVSFPNTSVRLILTYTQTIDNRGCLATFSLSDEYIQMDKEYRKEFDEK